MGDLIKALTIFLTYKNKRWPTHCEHDVMYVSIEPSIVSDKDKEELAELGFSVDEEYDVFKSYRFGSC